MSYSSPPGDDFTDLRVWMRDTLRHGEVAPPPRRLRVNWGALAVLSGLCLFWGVVGWAVFGPRHPPQRPQQTSARVACVDADCPRFIRTFFDHR